MAADFSIKFKPCSHTNTVIFVTTFSTLVTLAWITFIARIYTRWRLLRTLGVDDLFMGVSVVFFTILTSAAITLNNMLDRKDEIDFHNMSKAATLLLVSESAYILGMAWLKLSFCFFFLRIFINKAMIMTVKIVTALLMMTSIAFVLQVDLVCGVPIRMPDFWEDLVQHKCMKVGIILGFAYAQMAVSATTDILFVILPIIFVRGTRKPRREKIQIAAILALGAIGGLASFARVFYIKVLGETDDKYFQRFSHLGAWSGVECGTGIIAGCLACLRPLLRLISTAVRSQLGIESKPSEPPTFKTPTRWERALRYLAPSKNDGELLNSTIAAEDKFGEEGFTSSKLSESQVQSNKGDINILSSQHLDDTSMPSSLDPSAKSSVTMTSTQKSLVSTKGNPRWWRKDWWRPPQFEAGLMTEFEGGVRDADIGMSMMRSARRDGADIV